MAVIAQWGSIKFEILTDKALLFQDLRISAEHETADLADNQQKYVYNVNGKPLQITLSVVINSHFGQDVRKVLADLLNKAQRGESGYFYLAGSKLFPFTLMATKAETVEVKMAPNGRIESTTVDVTLRQSASQWISSLRQPDSPGPTTNKDSANTIPWTQSDTSAASSQSQSTAQAVHDAIAAQNAAKQVPSAI